MRIVLTGNKQHPVMPAPIQKCYGACLACQRLGGGIVASVSRGGPNAIAQSRISDWEPLNPRG